MPYKLRSATATANNKAGASAKVSSKAKGKKAKADAKKRRRSGLRSSTKAVRVAAAKEASLSLIERLPASLLALVVELSGNAPFLAAVEKPLSKTLVACAAEPAVERVVQEGAKRAYEEAWLPGIASICELTWVAERA